MLLEFSAKLLQCKLSYVMLAMDRQHEKSLLKIFRSVRFTWAWDRLHHEHYSSKFAYTINNKTRLGNSVWRGLLYRHWIHINRCILPKTRCKEKLQHVLESVRFSFTRLPTWKQIDPHGHIIFCKNSANTIVLCEYTRKTDLYYNRG